MAAVVRRSGSVNITFYVIVPNGFTLFFNANDNPPQLFNGNGKVNREVLEKKRQEIFSLPGTRAIDKVPTLDQCLFNYKNAKVPSEKGH